MALRKDTEFPAADQRLADVAAALSHPARIAILRLLAKRGTCICGEIVDELPLSQSTVSQHLKALKQAGLIRGEIEGPRTCYCLDAKAFAAAAQSLNALAAGIKRDAAACC
jgi:ArsR family transcriptional regulator, arsenate/arsenite/antimonite-responsive transcriptional repressor